MVPGNLPIGCGAIYLTIYETKDEKQYDKFGCLKWLNEFSKYYNHNLQIELNKLRALYPHLNIIYVDYYNAAMTLYRRPAKFGNSFFLVKMTLHAFILHQSIFIFI